MFGSNEAVKKSYWGAFSAFAISAVLFLVCIPANVRAQQKDQKTFASAEEASQAMITALEANDDAARLELLGKAGKDIISSGDPREDAENRANIIAKYKVLHRLVVEPDGSTTIYIGAENWPVPVPLVEKDGKWYFDTAAGKREVLFRRIGRNEISAIRVCEALVAAQKEYFAAEGNVYAAKIKSDEGQQDGLHWVSAEVDHRSPIGPRVANASIDGGQPFRGYYFRTLTAQGKDVQGGAMDYVSDGKMTKGFAFVAYPAVYRDSGVVTFVVDRDGVVYEKDLGKKTDALAKAMTEYDPDATWRKSDLAELMAPQEESTPK